MPRLGLVYEDESIRVAFEILTRKILDPNTEVVARSGGSWPGMVGDARRLLQVLSVEHISSPLDCVVVMFETNGTAPGSRIALLTGHVGNRTYRFGTPIYHGIVRQIETWLLGDHNALEQAAKGHLTRQATPETLADPKRYLIQVLANLNGGRVPYDRNFLRSVFESADLNQIAQTCPGFASFRQKLQNCRSQQLPLSGLAP